MEECKLRVVYVTPQQSSVGEEADDGFSACNNTMDNGGSEVRINIANIMFPESFFSPYPTYMARHFSLFIEID